MSNRVNGYYWVRYAGEWEVMYWSHGMWMATGYDMAIYPVDVEEVDEKRIWRGEPDNCTGQLDLIRPSEVKP